MVVGVPKETADGERRVAMVPDVVKRLAAKDVEVVVEAGAGEAALIPDALFEEAGAKIGDPWSADVVVKVAAPTSEEIGKLGDGSVLVGFLAPLTSAETTRALADAKVTAFAMEAIPRISRAQSMDALSSQSNVAGYKAALLGAEHSTRFYPMLTTAAGTIPPAKVLVLGGGVAGLQALATAKRLGARTTGYDVRPEVAEQVQSLGANWLDLGIEAAGEGGYARALGGGARAAAASAHRRDQGLRRRHHDGARARPQGADARHRGGGRGHEAGVGRRRPRGRVGRQLRAHRAGRGRRQGRRHDRLAAEPADDDARAREPALRAQRAVAHRAHARRRGQRQPELRGRGHRRRLRHARRRDRPRGREEDRGGRNRLMTLAVSILIQNLSVLVLAAFAGYLVISKVPNTLHTPLMSGTNAVHGIVVLGGIIVLGLGVEGWFTKLLLVIAIAFGTINVVGGFLVTDRMLEMFKSKPKEKVETSEELQ
jgi:NAD/NADP transhydrogenase alpha subunit